MHMVEQVEWVELAGHQRQVMLAWAEAAEMEVMALTLFCFARGL
jgi:hypothetical protein